MTRQVPWSVPSCKSFWVTVQRSLRLCQTCLQLAGYDGDRQQIRRHSSFVWTHQSAITNTHALLRCMYILASSYSSIMIMNHLYSSRAVYFWFKTQRLYIIHTPKRARSAGYHQIISSHVSKQTWQVIGTNQINNLSSQRVSFPLSPCDPVILQCLEFSTMSWALYRKSLEDPSHEHEVLLATLQTDSSHLGGKECTCGLKTLNAISPYFLHTQKYHNKDCVKFINSLWLPTSCWAIITTWTTIIH